MQFDHLIDSNNYKILKTDAHNLKRLTSEASYINFHLHVMSRFDGNNLLQVHHYLITYS